MPQMRVGYMYRLHVETLPLIIWKVQTYLIFGAKFLYIRIIDVWCTRTYEIPIVYDGGGTHVEGDLCCK